MRRWLVAGVLLAVPLAAFAQAKVSRAHMEACVRWVATGGQYLTMNSCDTAVSIQFMLLDSGRTIEKDVMPGSQFESGPIDTSNGAEMMFTVCPVGYVPNVKFAPENAEPISVSLYNCLPRDRPGV
ncbi:MAG: hypothetical protein JSR47_14820 [Proteobacteria bacterium]|nr:hypothetical protein [Pseudomonadota bacterium]